MAGLEYFKQDLLSFSLFAFSRGLNMQTILTLNMSTETKQRVETLFLVIETKF